MLRTRQCLDRIAVGRDIHGRGRAGDHREDGEDRGQVLKAKQTDERQAQRGNASADQHHAARAVTTACRQAVAVDGGRPEEFQRPGKGDQRKKAELVQRQPALAHDGGQARPGDTAHHALRHIEPANGEHYEWCGRRAFSRAVHFQNL